MRTLPTPSYIAFFPLHTSGYKDKSNVIYIYKYIAFVYGSVDGIARTLFFSSDGFQLLWKQQMECFVCVCIRVLCRLLNARFPPKDSDIDYPQKLSG